VQPRIQHQIRRIPDLIVLTFYSYNGSAYGSFLIDDVVKVANINDSPFQLHTVDTSAYSGLHTIKFLIAAPIAANMWIDDISAVSSNQVMVIR
jgi:hypothetical protein